MIRRGQDLDSGHRNAGGGDDGLALESIPGDLWLIFLATMILVQYAVDGRGLCGQTVTQISNKTIVVLKL